jgi:mono/diheme cytochrome c family protein
VTSRLAALLLVATSSVAGASGSSVFGTNCSPCHQPGGQGVPGAYPPLKDTVGAYVRVPEGRAYLVHVVAFGMTGAISSQGQTYNGFMQPWTQLSDADVTDVLNHILVTLNTAFLPTGFVPFTADEVHTLRAKHLSFDAVRSEREAVVKALGTADQAQR